MSLFSNYVPESRFHEEKCGWCSKQIGRVFRYPIPLCDACWPRGKPALWNEMGEEFRSEMKAWVKQMSKTLTQSDFTNSATQAMGDIHLMRVEQLRALRAGNPVEARRIEFEISERELTIKKYQRELPSLLSDQERES